MRVFFIALALSLFAAPAFAQDSDAPDRDGRCRQVAPGHVRCTEVRIEGSAPSSFLLLSRTRSAHRTPPLRRDMVREIRRTVRRTPF